MRSIRSRFLALGLVVMLVVGMMPIGAFAATGDGHAGLEAAGVKPQAVVPLDKYEPDDTTSTAKPMEAVSDHTWHPLASGDNDADWMYFTVEQTGTPYLIETSTPAKAGSFSDPYIAVYDEAGASMVVTSSIFDPTGQVWAGDDNMYFSYDAGVVFTAPAPGKYYVRVQSDDIGMGQWGHYRLYFHKGFGRRISGADRYSGAVAVSHLFWAGASNPYGGVDRGMRTGIVIASGVKTADAMTAGMLAAVTGSPLMLSRGPDAITSEMLAEIERLAELEYWGGIGPVGKVPGDPPPSYPKLPLYVVGGEASVSDELAEFIDRSPYLGEIVRVGGDDRYWVAYNVMDTIMEMHSVPADSVVPSAGKVTPNEATKEFILFVANGTAQADVLSAAPVAAACCSPLLLTRPNELPTSTKSWWSKYPVDRVVVVGGTSSVSEAVYNQLSAKVGGNIERISGSNRYSTAKKLVEWEIANCQHGVNTNRMVVVSGTAPSDAMMVVPLAYNMGNAPVLLTRADILSPEVKSHIDDYKPLTEVSYMIGGPASIWPSTYTAWRNYGSPWAIPASVPMP